MKIDNNVNYTRANLVGMPEFTPSKWDGLILNYSTTQYFSDYRPNNTNNSWLGFKRDCVAKAKAATRIDTRHTIWDKKLEQKVINPDYNTQHKDFQHSMIMTKFHTNLNKKNDNAYDRSLLALDFDEGDIAFSDIQALLKDYLYFGWTTFNHQVPKKQKDGTIKQGNRYRFVLPLDEIFPDADSFREYNASIENWIKTNGLAFDKGGSLTFCQLAVLPAINDRYGFIQFFCNDGPDTIKFSIKKHIPFIGPVAKPAPKNRVKLVDAVEEKLLELSAIGQAIIADLEAQRNLRGSKSYIDRLPLASAGIACNLTEDDIAAIDSIVKSDGADTDSYEMYAKAAAFTGKRTHYALTSLLTPMFKLSNNIGAAPTSQEMVAEIEYNSVWPVSYRVKDFVSDEHFGTAKCTLVRAETGTGKTYFWSEEYSGTKEIICLVPLRAIADQYSAGKGLVETYDYSAKLLEKIDKGFVTPEDTILVIDEAHELRIIGFRADALTNMEQLITGYNWNRVIFQSATIKPNELDTFIKIDEKIEVKRETPIIKNYIKVDRAEKTMTDAVTALVKSSHLQGRKAIVLFSNTAACNSIALALNTEGIPAIAATSANVANKHHEAYKLKSPAGFYMNDSTAIIGTAVMECGVSIKDKIDAYDVIIAGREPLAYIDQFAGRMREVKELNLYHIYNTTDKVNVKDYANFSSKFEYATTMQAMSVVAGMGESALNGKSEADKAASMWVHNLTTADIMTGGINFTETNEAFTHGYQPLFVAHAYETYIDYNNIDVLHANMRYLGFTVQPEVNLDAHTFVCTAKAKAAIKLAEQKQFASVAMLLDEYIDSLDTNDRYESSTINKTVNAKGDLPINGKLEIYNNGLKLYDVAYDNNMSAAWFRTNFVPGLDVDAIATSIIRSKSNVFNVTANFATLYPVGKPLSKDEVMNLYSDICQFLVDEVSKVERCTKDKAFKKLNGSGKLKGQSAVSFDAISGKCVVVAGAKVPLVKIGNLFCTIEKVRSRTGDTYQITAHH